MSNSSTSPPPIDQSSWAIVPFPHRTRLAQVFVVNPAQGAVTVPGGPRLSKV
jgi:hypothetical protein